MNYTIDKEDDTYTASTDDYIGTFIGYGETEADAIEDLKIEIEFWKNGGYSKTQKVNKDNS